MKYYNNLTPLIKDEVICTNFLIDNEVSLPVGVSKFGGSPDLSEDINFPLNKKNKLMKFLAQINLDDHSPMSTTDLRLIRRIVRDKQFRNSSAENTLNMWQSVRNGEFKWIYPHQEQSDYVFNSELSYELCILKKYALPLLKEIKPDDQYYPVANRLIKYLKYFKPLDESLIPCNSLLREFIGGSCFNV